MIEIETTIYNECYELLPRHWVNVLFSKNERLINLDGWSCKLNDVVLLNKDNQTAIYNDIDATYNNTIASVLAISITLFIIIASIISDISNSVMFVMAIAILLMWIAMALLSELQRVKKMYARSLVRELINIVKYCR